MKNFIPKQYKNEQITIRMIPERLEMVDRIAARYHLSRSAFINQCVDYALAHMEENRMDGEKCEKKIVSNRDGEE